LVKQRENYRFVILEPAKTRIENGQCPVCGKPKSEWTRRTDWRCCSAKCTEEFDKHCTYFGWPDLREKALKRDGYRCVKCRHQPTTERYHSADTGLVLNKKMKHGCKVFTVIDTSKLIGDHIVPIALGGDEWDIGNVQTLCVDCNKVKTRRDQADIARLRKKEALQSEGQCFLTDSIQ